MINRDLIERLKNQSTWNLLVLSSITFGVYSAHYIMKQSDKINGELNIDDRVSSVLVYTILITSYVSLGLMYALFNANDGHPIEKVVMVVNLALMILGITWGFAARNRVNKLCNIESTSDNWFHGFWTLIFPVLYFNYKVNSILENNEEHEPIKPGNIQAFVASAVLIFLLNRMGASESTAGGTFVFVFGLFALAITAYFIADFFKESTLAGCIGSMFGGIAIGVFIDVTWDGLVNSADRNLFPIEILMWFLIGVIPIVIGYTRGK